MPGRRAMGVRPERLLVQAVGPNLQAQPRLDVGARRHDAPRDVRLPCHTTTVVHPIEQVNCLRVPWVDASDELSVADRHQRWLQGLTGNWFRAMCQVWRCDGRR